MDEVAEMEEILIFATMESMNETNSTNMTVVNPLYANNPPIELQITLYSIILLLSVVGNFLVIVTLVQNKRMRTVTNVFLLNLAISDLLLGIFCMPFTLIGSLLRAFIFGEFMCKALPYFQATSVSVSVWTLVVISLERYFAICQPLRSRSWQTLSHSYKMIAAVWVISLLLMTPILMLSELLPLNKPGAYKCREVWPSWELEIVFNIFLDVLLLLLPLFIMMAAYLKICICLWKGIQIERQATVGANYNQQSNPSGKNNESAQKNNYKSENKVDYNKDSDESPPSKSSDTSYSKQPFRRRLLMRPLRSTNFDKSLAAKKRVVLMLFVVVLEFFICWTPLYTVNTLSIFQYYPGSAAVTYIQLLAYISSCCNPITYCFMNRKFRQAFLQAFGCRHRFSRRGTRSSANGTSFYNRQSTNRTVIEDKELETQL